MVIIYIHFSCLSTYPYLCICHTSTTSPAQPKNMQKCPLLHGANFPHMPKVRPENLFDKLKSQWSGLQSHGGTKLERRHNPQMHGHPITLWATTSNSCGLAT